MTDRPEIKIGQRWVTRGGEIVRVLDVDGSFDDSITVRGCGQPYSVRRDGVFTTSLMPPHDCDLISLAPSTVKREVALYQWKKTTEPGVESSDGRPFCAETTGPQHPAWRQISEPLTIEFTLLPGESA